MEKLCRNGPLAMKTAKEIAVRCVDLESGFVLEKVLGQRVLASERLAESDTSSLRIVASSGPWVGMVRDSGTVAEARSPRGCAPATGWR